MVRISLGPNTAQVAMAVRQAASSRAWSKALVLLEESREAGFKVDAGSQSVVLAACVRSHASRHAVRIFDQIKADGDELDVSLCNAAISAMGKCQDWQRALHLAYTMHLQEVLPDVTTLNACMTACERTHRWEEAVALLADVGAWSATPNLVSFTQAMTTCGLASHWEATLALLAEATRSRVVDNVISWTAASSACGRASLWELSMTLLDEARSRSVELDASACATVASACIRASEWEQTLQVLQDMTGMRIEQTLQTFTIAITAHGKAQQWRTALAAMEEAKDNGFMDAKMQRTLDKVVACGRKQEEEEEEQQQALPPEDAARGAPVVERARAPVPARSVADMTASFAEGEREERSPRVSSERSDVKEAVVPPVAETAARADPFVAMCFADSGRLAVASGSAQCHVAYLCGMNAAARAASMLAACETSLVNHRLMLLAGDTAAGHSLKQWKESLETTVDVVVLESQLRELADVTQDVEIHSALIDFTGMSLPPHAFEWLQDVEAKELARVFRRYGDQDDDLLWERLAEVVCMTRDGGRHAPVETGARAVARMMSIATKVLDDPAGPSQRLALNAIRAHLLAEDDQIARALEALHQRLQIGGRCCILHTRRGMSAHLNSVIATYHDCDWEYVKDWPLEKLCTLYPLLSMDSSLGCFAEIGASAAAEIHAASQKYQIWIRALEKRQRTSPSFPDVQGVPLESLFCKPQDVFPTCSYTSSIEEGQGK